MSLRESFHEKSRRVVCGVCFTKPKSKQSISPIVLSLIQKYCKEDYSLDLDYLPTVICKSCVNCLKALESGSTNRKLMVIDYTSLIKPMPVTRSGDSEKCHCSICEIAYSVASL